MINPFSQVACPKCGAMNKPLRKDPGNDTTSNVLSFIPGVNLAYEGYRLANSTFHCSACGHQFTRSLADRAGEFSAKVSARIQAPVCGSCHVALPQPVPKFCPECGARTAPPDSPGPA